MVLLGIDYGTAKIGLAIAEGKVAVPLRVVRYVSQRELREAIRAACTEHDAKAIVVGMPAHERGSVEEFIAWLKREVTMPVLSEDEQLTTQFAKRLIRGWRGKADDDAIAATLILQSHIERTEARRHGRTVESS